MHCKFKDNRYKTLCTYCGEIDENASSYICEVCNDVAADFFICHYSFDEPTAVCQVCSRDLQIFICDRCGAGSIWYDAFTYLDRYGHYLCNSCSRRVGIVSCYRCDDLIYPDDSHNLDGYTFCEHCYHDELEEYSCDSSEYVEVKKEDPDNFDKTIYPYDYKPDVFYTRRRWKKENLFGLELEVEPKGDSSVDDVIDVVCDTCEDIAVEQATFIYFKEDGSIRGIEIVSMPTSRRLLQKYFRSIINKLDSIATSHDNGRCGLHIHIEKSAIDATTAAKLFELLPFGFLLKLSRRNEELFGKWCSRWYYNEIDKSTTDERYRCINPLPHETNELRIFRGTLYSLSFLFCLQFAEALIDFCNQYKSFVKIRFAHFRRSHNSYDGKTYRVFRDFIENHYLQQMKFYLKERGI